MKKTMITFLVLGVSAGLPQVDEHERGNSVNDSIQRYPDGNGSRRVGSDFIVGLSSPAVANSP